MRQWDLQGNPAGSESTQKSSHTILLRWPKRSRIRSGIKKKIASLLKLLLGLLILPTIFQLLLSCEMEWASEHKHELPAKDIRSCRRNWTLYWTWPPAEGRRHLHLCCWLQCPFFLHPPNIQKHISPLYIVWQVDKVCKTIVKQIKKFKLSQAPKLRSKLH